MQENAGHSLGEEAIPPSPLTIHNCHNPAKNRTTILTLQLSLWMRETKAARVCKGPEAAAAVPAELS